MLERYLPSKILLVFIDRKKQASRQVLDAFDFLGCELHTEIDKTCEDTSTETTNSSRGLDLSLDGG